MALDCGGNIWLVCLAIGDGFGTLVAACERGRVVRLLLDLPLDRGVRQTATPRSKSNNLSKSN